MLIFVKLECTDLEVSVQDEIEIRLVILRARFSCVVHAIVGLNRFTVHDYDLLWFYMLHLNVLDNLEDQPLEVLLAFV